MQYAANFHDEIPKVIAKERTSTKAKHSSFLNRQAMKSYKLRISRMEWNLKKFQLELWCIGSNDSDRFNARISGTEIDINEHMKKYVPYRRLARTQYIVDKDIRRSNCKINATGI